MKDDKTKRVEGPSCPLNEGVVCWPGERNCSGCGWHPFIAKKRLEHYCSTHGVRVPEEKNGKLT